MKEKLGRPHTALCFFSGIIKLNTMNHHTETHTFIFISVQYTEKTQQQSNEPNQMLIIKGNTYSGIMCS